MRGGQKLFDWGFILLKVHINSAYVHGSNLFDAVVVLAII